VESTDGTEPARSGLRVLQPCFRREHGGRTADAIPERELCMTAAALARLHTSTLRFSGPVRTAAGEAARARQRAASLAAYYPSQAELIERTAVRLAARLERLEPGRYRPAHGGFKPSQLLFHSQRVFVLDLDGLCLAYPALDAG